MARISALIPILRGSRAVRKNHHSSPDLRPTLPVWHMSSGQFPSQYR